MTEVFGAAYASAYDTLYQDKDYGAECDQIERAFRKYGESIHTVLDLGCGTGNHAIPLAQRGYQVTGVDRSAEMLARAEKKAPEFADRKQLTFHHSDIQQLELGHEFDAGLLMFAVLGYQKRNADVLSALTTTRRHIRSGGLLVFDVWYGPAVLNQRPSQRVKVIENGEGKLLRVVSGELNTDQHLCHVDYHMWQLHADRLVASTEERHSMRYFFPLELELFFQLSNFRLLRLGRFPEFDQDATESTWNVMGIAQAV
jgi:SAM-dependent methyltransferase